MSHKVVYPLNRLKWSFVLKWLGGSQERFKKFSWIKPWHLKHGFLSIPARFVIKVFFKLSTIISLLFYVNPRRAGDDWFPHLSDVECSKVQDHIILFTNSVALKVSLKWKHLRTDRNKCLNSLIKKYCKILQNLSFHQDYHCYKSPSLSFMKLWIKTCSPHENFIFRTYQGCIEKRVCPYIKFNFRIWYPRVTYITLA